ncbi:Vps33p [Rhizophagus irregularis DAOM 197198w]|uniref:Vps33p n=1 Tax=Rhizophagus irregularis (strain DAOM 197198w) TaxID=1432141 RepID=A0A015M7K4_RHIIW|nr:Vps33p [Rhizophagus irregularis DAOM 197198w]
MSHLGNTHSSLNVNSLRDLARKELTNVLDSVRGKKCLVLDPNISGPLSLIAGFSLLKEHGVEKVHYLQQGPLETELKSLIYICRPQLNYMKYIAEHIAHHQKDVVSNYEYNLFFVPRRTMICERVLEEAGVFGEITIGEYHLDLIPFEDDLLSLELDNTFKELYLDGDYTSIYYAARALMKLQTKFGLIPRVIGKGDCAKHLADMLLRMRKEVAVDDPSSTLSVSQNVDSLIILDRSVDLISPLCTQLTYEGLIDEVFGIRASHVEVDSAIVGPASQKSAPAAATSTSNAASTTSQPSTPAKKKKIPLNSSDRLFVQLRDMNFAVVGGVLNRVARRINENYEERHQAKTVMQIREFINKLGGLQSEHQSLRTHTGIAEEIMAYTVTPEFNKALEVQQNLVAGIEINLQNEHIEEMINRQVPILQVLRLLCLLSLVNGGLKQKSLEFFKKEILQTYGFEHLQTLLNLERLNMFVKQGSASSKFNYVRKHLQLIVDEVDEQSPQDISYVYSGYAPLSVRLIQCVTKGGLTPISNPVGANAAANPIGTGGAAKGIVGWKGHEEALKMLPGKTFDEVQKLDDGAIHSKKFAQGQQPRVTLIFFLGGCTYTEISAIRFMAQQDEGQREYVIATTQIVNGNSLLSSVMQKMDNLGHSAGGNF